MNYKEAEKYILEIPKFTSKNPLEHTKELLARLGDPQKEKKVIHVAGTNGKGSVCAYLQSLLLSEGRRVGLFTSPHIVSMKERIRVNGKEVSGEEFLNAFETVYSAVMDMQREGKKHATFFEFLFAMAMETFRKKDVEYVILETGLGGRLDATNAVESLEMTIITSISLDHTDILGDTLAKIAEEKAGIIKAGVPLILDGSSKEEALGVIRKKAVEMGAPCREISKCAYKITETKESHIAFSMANAYYEDVVWRLSNPAPYQAMNAALALEAFVWMLQPKVKHIEVWKQALEHVHWEGRMEEIRKGIIVDGAHNPGAVEGFVESVCAGKDAGKKRVLLFSAVKDKNYEEMIRILCEKLPARAYVVTTIKDERCVLAEELKNVFEKYTDREVVAENDLDKALKAAQERSGEDGVVYCLGSLYLVGMIKKRLQEENFHVEF